MMRREDERQILQSAGEAFGSVESVLARALDMARRNPIPVLLIAAGTGWLMHSMTRSRAEEHPAEDIPVLNTGHSRLYDPDVSPRHPMHDTLESRREMSARM